MKPPSAMPAFRKSMILMVLLLELLAVRSFEKVAAEQKPNIIVVILDDVDHKLGADAPDRLPKLSNLVAKQGINFTNYFVNFALCCPSRVSLLTGRCTHNTGVVYNLNSGFLGGESRFIENGHENRSIATWLKRAGYRTGLVGKYLNGYGFTPGRIPAQVPPGWDDWLAFITINYYNWTASDNGVNVSYGNSTADYSTDVIRDRAASFIKKSANDTKPFFLYVAPYAAHSPAIPAKRHEGKFKHLKVPRTPNYAGTYASIKQKVTALRAYPKIQQSILDLYDFIYQKRQETLLAVDDLLDTLITLLETQGQLNNTYIFITSDNGYHFGHHKMLAGKTSPYEEDIHLFLYARGPKIPAGIKLPHLIGNIDLAPTIAELAGADTGLSGDPPVDGISFAKILTDPVIRAQDPDLIRQGFLIEKLVLDSETRFISPQTVISNLNDDAFRGYRAKTQPFWNASYDPPSRPFLRNQTLQPGDVNYDNNNVNKGTELTPDGKYLRNGPFGNGDGAGTLAVPYYSKFGFSAETYTIGVGFGFPSSYYAVRISNKKFGDILFVEAYQYGHELYNITKDPYQLYNVFSTADRGLLEYLQNLLDHLKYCYGSDTCSPRSSVNINTFVFDAAKKRPRA